MSTRYVHLDGNLYFDTKDKTIVKNMGDRYVFLRHDRRTKTVSVEDEKREFNKKSENLIPVSSGLYYDKKLRQLYRKTGNNLVLYSKDRRKETKKVHVDCRKNRP